MEAMFAALFTAVAAFFSWKASHHSKRVDKKTDTNHGLEPWQYLEMILDVKETQIDLKKALVDHTAQDADNFKALADLIREQN